MAIEMNNRTKILAGVVGLAAVGAGAWFFFLDDFLNAPPPKPAAKASVPASAAKPAAKPAADAPKQAGEAPKQAAAPLKPPSARIMPTEPDKMIAEIIETSGVTTYLESFGRQAAVSAAAAADPTQKRGLSPAESRELVDLAGRTMEPGKTASEVAANLKGTFDAERMTRFIELLRQPIAQKVGTHQGRLLTPEAMNEYQESARKNPPSAARSKLIQTLDDVTGASDLGVDITAATARELFDTTLAQMQKSGKNVPAQARKVLADQMNTLRNQARATTRSMLFAMYRGVSDEDLAEYVKNLDTDTGRWGSGLIAAAAKPPMVNRAGTLGRELAQTAMNKRGAPAPVAAAPAPAAADEKAPAQEKPAPAPLAAAAPAAPVGYQRPTNIREAYSRYNDVITATVMRDRAAVKELLDDGKNPNLRQSNGITPLMVAASNGDNDIAAMLLAKGADANARAGGRSVLSFAKARGSAGADMVRLLERSGAKD
jgi:hypothetical protein